MHVRNETKARAYKQKRDFLLATANQAKNNPS